MTIGLKRVRWLCSWKRLMCLNFSSTKRKVKTAKTSNYTHIELNVFKGSILNRSKKCLSVAQFYCDHNSFTEFLSPFRILLSATWPEVRGQWRFWSTQSRGSPRRGVERRGWFASTFLEAPQTTESGLADWDPMNSSSETTTSRSTHTTPCMVYLQR